MRAACPSGVQYDRLIETTRAHIEQHHRRTPGERLLRRLIFERLPAPAPPARRARRSRGCRRRARSRRLPRARTAWHSAWPPVEHLPGEAGARRADGRLRAERRLRRRERARPPRARGRRLRRDVPQAQSCCGALARARGAPRRRACPGAEAADDFRAATTRSSRTQPAAARTSRTRSRTSSTSRSCSSTRRRGRSGSRFPSARRVPGLVPPPPCAAHRLRAARALQAIPGLVLSSPPSRISAAAAPASTTSCNPTRRGSSGTARRSTCSRPSRRRTRAANPGAWSGHGGAPPRRQAGARSIRSSSSMRRSAASTAGVLASSAPLADRGPGLLAGYVDEPVAALAERRADHDLQVRRLVTVVVGGVHDAASR